MSQTTITPPPPAPAVTVTPPAPTSSTATVWGAPVVSVLAYFVFLVAIGALLLPVTAFAQQAVTVVAASPKLDLTGIAVTVIAGVFGIATPVALLWIQSHIKDQAAAATLAAAVKNSLGAIQQAATAGVVVASPSVSLPASTPPGIVVGVQYALDHAGDEAKRLGITQEMIASKVNAAIGLANIDATVAAKVPGAPAVPAVIPSKGIAAPIAAPVVPAIPA